MTTPAEALGQAWTRCPSHGPFGEVGSWAGNLCPGGSAGGRRAGGRHVLLWDGDLRAD